MKTPILKSHRLIIAFLMVLSLSACALTGGPINGMVLEDETDQPIAGAIVVVRWKGDLPGFADSNTVCYHVESTLTDEAGRYRIAKWKKKPDPERDWERRIINKVFGVSAYKVGYGFSTQKYKVDENEYLAMFEGSTEERLKYLLRISGATSCPGAGTSQEHLLLWYRAILEEIQQLNDTGSAQTFIDGIIFRIEIIELGYKAAEERYVERLRTRTCNQA